MEGKMTNEAKECQPNFGAINESASDNNSADKSQSELSRRDVLLMGAITASTLFASNAVSKAATASPEATLATEPYVARDFNGLLNKKLEGLSQNQLSQHLKLYQGYVKKANEIHRKLKDVDLASANPTYSPVRELLVEQSYALNGAIYHEYYFANLGGKGGDPTGDLRAALDERFGNYSKFADYLKAAGKSMRGWVIVGYNTRINRIDTFGLDLHNVYTPANIVPVLVLDVYEHAYMIDYGIDRAKYLDAFMQNIDWEIASKRFAMAIKSPCCLVEPLA
jgi:Fe-Mn family superoxide dismutase